MPLFYPSLLREVLFYAGSAEIVIQLLFARDVGWIVVVHRVISRRDGRQARIDEQAFIDAAKNQLGDELFKRLRIFRFVHVHRLALIGEARGHGQIPFALTLRHGHDNIEAAQISTGDEHL